MSDPVASEKDEERKDEDEDFDDLEEDKSGGESERMSVVRESIAEIAMSKEWTRGLLPAGIDTGCVLRTGGNTGWVCCSCSVEEGETPDGGEGDC